MAKRQTDLDKAIAQIDADITEMEVQILARRAVLDSLIAIRTAKPARKPRTKARGEAVAVAA